MKKFLAALAAAFLTAFPPLAGGPATSTGGPWVRAEPVTGPGGPWGRHRSPGTRQRQRRKAARSTGK